MSDPHHLEKNTGLIVGGVGALTALAGSGVGIALNNKNEAAVEDVPRFIVSDDTLGATGDLPPVINIGGSRFVFLPGATGEVELQGDKPPRLRSCSSTMSFSPAASTASTVGTPCSMPAASAPGRSS